MDGDKLKIVFEPGAFDDFEGTQEELDELIAEITRMAESGELLTMGVPLSDTDMASLPDDVRQWLDGDDANARRNRLN